MVPRKTRKERILTRKDKPAEQQNRITHSKSKKKTPQSMTCLPCVRLTYSQVNDRRFVRKLDEYNTY